MFGPYFLGQEAAACGCFYPDVTRLREGPKSTRTLYCILHGEVVIPYRGLASGADDIPSEEWRESERRRLREK